MMSFVQTQKTDKRGAVTLGPMMQGPVTITAKASRRSAPQTATTSIDLREIRIVPGEAPQGPPPDCKE